jgi:hypothetical protein
MQLHSAQRRFAHHCFVFTSLNDQYLGSYNIAGASNFTFLNKKNTYLEIVIFLPTKLRARVKVLSFWLYFNDFKTYKQKVSTLTSLKDIIFHSFI